MTFRRTTLTYRVTALLLAIAMPLCCCVLNAAAGSSCCDASPVEACVAVESCCSATVCEVPADEDPSSSESSCDAGNCLCCLKAMSPSFEWSPPLDTVGTPLDLPFVTAVADAFVAPRHSRAGPDRFPPGPCAVGERRGDIVLQV